jgi:hypothetical protein
MIETIHLIDWAHFGFPQIPELLQQLTTPNARVQNEAYSTIQWFIVYDGGSFEDIERGYGPYNFDVHFIFVPILIEIARNEALNAQGYALNLLGEMAGYVQLEDTDNTKMRDIHQLIWGGLAIYLQLLESDNEGIVLSTLYLLSSYPEHFHSLQAFYFAALERASTDNQRARILWCLYNALPKPTLPDKLQTILLTALSNTSNPVSRITAAICLVNHFKADAPSPSIEIVARLAADLETRTARILAPGYETAFDLIRAL